ncbi:MAG: hypothetical protein CMM94_05500 [Rickettsiales bacterium]|nr:hypothetical protein [Rickettsiales bacterium]
MGYLREMKALGARRNRCLASWQIHLERSQGSILKAARQCEQKHRALIVGSGLLFDIPVRELSRLFDEVVLLDIVHLWRVHRSASQLPNVRLIQRDVTDIVERSFMAGRKRIPVSVPRRQLNYLLDDGFDLVVSANILSQLPVLPNEYLSRRIPSLEKEQTSAFSRTLVESHLDWISSFPGVTCLIADLERLYCKEKEIVRREGSLWGVTLPGAGEQWIWDLAPRPEIDFQLDIRHRVIGYTNFPKQAWLQRDRLQADSALEVQAQVEQ